MHERCIQKSNAHLANASSDFAGRKIYRNAKGFEHIGAAALTRNSTVAMFGHALPGAGYDKGRGRRDVEGVGAVAARAAGIENRLMGLVQIKRLTHVANRLRESDQFGNRFAL